MIDLRFVPLAKWPTEETKSRRNAPFRSNYLKTLDLLETELKKIGAREIVVESFYRTDQIRNDGWPKANQNPSHPGVIISFKKLGERFQKSGKWFFRLEPLSFPCDTYHHIEHNIHAIALSLQALRAVDRYGVTKRSEQYTGWKQIEAPPTEEFNSKEEAAAFLVANQEADVPSYQVIADVALRAEVYRLAARRLHPDAPTGNHELFLKLGQAKALLDASAARS